MHNGNWIPVSKALVCALPGDREYTELEAMFSVSVDYDCNNPASISGYASQWRWSRKRVSNFMKKHGLTLTYAEKYNRHARGQVGYQVGNRKGTGKAQVEFIDSKALRAAGNRRGAGGEQEGNRKGSTTKDPNPNPNPKDKKKADKPPVKKFDPMTIKPDWITAEDWSDLVTHRKSHPKKPAQTKRAYTAIITQLSIATENGFSVSECIDKMTSSSWAGFDASWMRRDNPVPGKKRTQEEEIEAQNTLALLETI